MKIILIIYCKFHNRIKLALAGVPPHLRSVVEWTGHVQFLRWNTCLAKASRYGCTLRPRNQHSFFCHAWLKFKATGRQYDSSEVE